MIILAVQWRDATRRQSKACIIIEGASGSGKSGLALTIARALSDSWDKVYAIDTENRSLDLYEGLRLHTGEAIGAFRKVDIMPAVGYAPTTYVACKESAISNGAQAVITDSTSHMWVGHNGVLDLVSKTKAKMKTADSYRVWGDEPVMRE